MEDRTSIWPFDILKDPRPTERKSPSHLRCFVICPFTPYDIFEDLYFLIKKACQQVNLLLTCHIECIRSDKISSSGVIHAEIWHEIQSSDIVIADVSGLNGNVMIELGVAAACRKKEHVIILKEENPKESFLFDIGPARHIVYKRTFHGFQDLLKRLIQAILTSLTSAPFEIEPKISPKLPLKIDFSKGKDVDWLVGPSTTLRRLKPKYLEFGSLFVFRNSWLSVAGLLLSKFEITAEIKFSQLRNIEGWVGISVRNQHFFANYGHLLYLTSSGKVVRTIPENELAEYHDEIIGSISDFNTTKDKFFKFRIKVDDHEISMFVDKIGKSFKISEMPFVYPSGRILFQTFRARMGIRSIEIKNK